MSYATQPSGAPKMPRKRKYNASTIDWRTQPLGQMTDKDIAKCLVWRPKRGSFRCAAKR